MSVDRYEPFDLKITKLTGKQWDRVNMQNLALQLMQFQGQPRASVENRIIIIFDNSPTSDIDFMRSNRQLLIKGLLNIAWNPYSFLRGLDPLDIWIGLVLIPETDYCRLPKYYEHPIGLGLREGGKAVFEFSLLQEIEKLSGSLIKYNRNSKEHGYDGDLLVDREKITIPTQQPKLYDPIPVCDYGTPPVPDWKNCLPCPLNKDGHCLSRGAIIWRATHRSEEL